jgi:hypothetical protein
MRLDSSNTLAYHLDIPQRKAYNLGQLSTTVFASAVKTSKPKGGNQTQSFHSPDYDAAEFYALNQVMALLQSRFAPDEPLPPWANTLAAAYGLALAKQAIVACHYLILICTRESRHLTGPAAFWSLGKGSGANALFKKFHATYAKTDPETAQTAFINHVPDLPMGEYCEALCTSFLGGYSSGFGGKKWHNIAMCLEAFISGKTSAEMMVDTVYTLAHNGGPIFNKGMYYHHHTEDLVKILDIQRSGQVCEMVFEGVLDGALSMYGDKNLVGLRKLVLLAKENLPSIGSYVDWFKVESLGSHQQYPVQKQQQMKVHGKPTVEKAKAEPAVKKIVLVDGKPVKFTTKFEVLPEVYVEVYERVHA